ncbi:MAG TPA: LysR substrate-binding domain-containing protein [Armatimonadota bacterium]|nr:LysR substrate-binding domain-containing protein [Armatimonadota bacterium]
MELRHLRYFVAVAEELHFGRAAERLFMAQPPLSQQIRQLEDEMGVALFTRTNRRVQLTAAGQIFLKEAREILAHVDEAVITAQRASRGETGWFGVGFVASAIYGMLPSILRRFRELYPAVELELLELPSLEQWQALRDKRIHIGFARLPEEESGIILERVELDTFMVALPATHKLADRTSVPLLELATESFIQYPQQSESNYADYVFHVCEEAGFTPHIVQKTGEIQTALSLVDAGIGVALVPTVAQNLCREGVVYRPLAAPAPTIELTMGYRQDDPSPILPLFLAVARQIVRGE